MSYSVYVLFDANDEALYVGCTKRSTARLSEHAEKTWWQEVTRAEIHHFGGKWDGKWDALAAEKELMIALRPKHHLGRKGQRELGHPERLRRDWGEAA